MAVSHPPAAGHPVGPVRERLPLLFGLATAVVALVNIVSAALPDVAGRLHDVLALGAVQEVVVAHQLGMPLGLSLLVAAWQLGRGRQGALAATVAVLALLGAVDLLRGLDVEEATLTWALAAVLWNVRGAFPVRLPDTVALPWLVPTVAGAAAVVFVIADPPAPRAEIALAVAGALLLAAGLGRLLRPARPVPSGCADELARAAAIVRGHGADTLSAFKLRRDLERCFSADGRAFTGRRVQAGALLVAGDPVGPPDAAAAALRQAWDDARALGLTFGVVGASERCAEEGRVLGLKSMYLGDEAMIPTGPMDLSGGPRKSLRKAVNRVARSGFTAELHEVGSLDDATVQQLRVVSTTWLDGEPERGFSMAHDALVDDLLSDALVVLARDADGVPRGFLHFMPVFGQPVASLGFMRRDPSTPNGLTDFLVVEAARLLGERGVVEFSLNFAAFGRWLRAPDTLVERWLATLLRVGDRWFQVERLHRYNAKFDPRWQPRYLLFEGPGAWPRVAVAAMAAEGQLPLPRIVTRPGAPAPA